MQALLRSSPPNMLLPPTSSSSHQYFRILPLIPPRSHVSATQKALRPCHSPLLFRHPPLNLQLSWQQSLCSSQQSLCESLGVCGLPERRRRVVKAQGSAAYNTSSPADLDDAVELNKRAQVSKRLERTANYFKRLGSLGFWGQLVCTVVSAVILAFSVAVTGTSSSKVTFYLTAGGIAAAFMSVFWSFGYIRLSQRLRNTVHDLEKAPPRAEVVKNLKNGLIINLVGMASTLLGMQATVGVLVAKALTSSAGPYLQGAPTGYSPVLALDVFLVQASANTLLSHFLGLVISLELLRSVTLSQPPPENVIPKPA